MGIVALHKDPSVFKEPDVFDESRFAPERSKMGKYQMLPFGSGGRVCLGKSKCAFFHGLSCQFLNFCVI